MWSELTSLLVTPRVYCTCIPVLHLRAYVCLKLAVGNVSTMHMPPVPGHVSHSNGHSLRGSVGGGGGGGGGRNGRGSRVDNLAAEGLFAAHAPEWGP